MNELRKIVVASGNKNKIREISEIFNGVEIVSMQELGFDGDIPETGETFKDNAYIKAKFIAERFNVYALADDSGLCVTALGGAPGVYSARYGGPELDDAARYRLLLENMRGTRTRTAHFTSCIACVFPNGDTLEAEGVCPGTIAFAPQGDGGFGYDPVFFLPELRKTYAQLTAEEKAAVSHRGKALAVFDGKLRAYLGKQ